MSDFEDEYESESSGEDFSASEDDWVPETTKSKGAAAVSSSSSDEESDFAPSQKKGAQKRTASKTTTAPRRLKNVKPVLGRSVPPKQTKKQSTTASGKTKSTKKETPVHAKKDVSDAESSSSSGDDYMVDPNQLDLGSAFFEPSTSGSKSLEDPPKFDCNAGLGQLSDSDNDDMEDVPIESQSSDTQRPEHVSLNKNAMFMLDLEKAKVHLVNFKSENKGKDEHCDVGQLLAMGEKSSTAASSQKKRKADSRKKEKAESGSDWEEVSEKKPKVTEDVVIMVRPTIKQKKDRNQLEMEAAIKRTLNRRRNEVQMMLHKTHILCWIGHGNHVNAVLNHPKLMQLCLAFMPSKYTYPKDRTNLTYFEQITKWYNNQMKLKEDRVHPVISRLPPLAISLALQIQSKAAICKKMYVLMFIVLIRAIGVQCRLMMNLVTLPMRPPQCDLLAVSIKSENDVEKKVKVKTEDSKSEGKSKERTKCTSNSQKEDPKNNHSSSSKKETEKGTQKSSLSSPKKEIIKERDKTTNGSLKKEISKEKPKSNMGLPKKEIDSKSVKPESKSNSKTDSITDARPKRSTRSSAKTKSPTKSPSKSSKPPIATSHPIVTSQYFSPKSERNVPNSSRTTKVKEATSKAPVTSAFFLNKNDLSKSKPINPQVAKLKQMEKNRLDRRLLSTDDDDDNDLEKKPKKSSSAMDVWLEVYSEEEEQWMAVDLFKQKIHSIDSIRNSLTKPVSYVLAWNNDNSIKDVSSRYCLNWNTVTRKQRVEKTWLDEVLLPYRETPTYRTRAEDLELNKIHLKEPLPKTISEFKDHPLYALQRHLLKFQAIYPPDAPSLGFIRGEPIYARECVHTLHSRDIWVKSARVVKPNQTAYKIVKARPKWNRQTNTCEEPLPLEIFGFWQTQPYDPPTAENGKVPRNAYGNVELFLPEMLPKKTVHLQLPGLNRTCKKLNIDCANAMVGFDFHSGSSHPTYDGFVVCEEFAEQVVAQYWLDQEEAQRREEEKIKQRVYGNWKKLIKGLLIRERLQRKYNFAEPSDKATPPKVAKKSRK